MLFLALSPGESFSLPLVSESTSKSNDVRRANLKVRSGMRKVSVGFREDVIIGAGVS
jgi:hypothetical protein